MDASSNRLPDPSGSQFEPASQSVRQPVATGLPLWSVDFKPVATGLQLWSVDFWPVATGLPQWSVDF